jgi:hypothetical protein
MPCVSTLLGLLSNSHAVLLAALCSPRFHNFHQRAVLCCVVLRDSINMRSRSFHDAVLSEIDGISHFCCCPALRHSVLSYVMLCCAMSARRSLWQQTHADVALTPACRTQLGRACVILLLPLQHIYCAVLCCAVPCQPRLRASKFAADP